MNITKDNFPEAKKYLFGPGLEDKVSKWVETAQVITTALNPSRDQRSFVMSGPSNIPGQTSLRITGITREGSREHPTFQVFETSCSRAHNVKYPKYTVKHFFQFFRKSLTRDSFPMALFKCQPLGARCNSGIPSPFFDCNNDILLNSHTQYTCYRGPGKFDRQRSQRNETKKGQLTQSHALYTKMVSSVHSF